MNFRIFTATFFSGFRIFRQKFAELSVKIADITGFHRLFKSLWRRIVVINLLGLIIFIGGIFYLNEFRKSLVEANVRSLETHGEIIAVALAAAAHPDVRNTNNPVDLGELLSNFGETEDLFREEEDLRTLEFSINPSKIAPGLRHLLEPTNTRARIYSLEGALLLDSNDFYAQGQIIRKDTAEEGPPRKGVIHELWRYISNWIWQTDLPLYRDIGKDNGKAYTEVESALGGTSSRMLRLNEKGETVVSVAVPIKHLRTVRGVLLLSSKGGEIDAAIYSARLEISRVALIAVLVALLSSMYLASTIAGPMRRLSAAAERVRKSIKARAEIPDFTKRRDEIGHLSGALRDMTSALYQRIDAIESFAADVSHELKNPMTSLRSAAETLSIARTEEDKKHLIDIILNDVGRLNRLITDIAGASRLDAELVRAERTPVDIAELIKMVTSIFNDIHRDDTPKVDVLIKDSPLGRNAYIVNGHDGRLGQVLNNLLDNAISFTPENCKVTVKAERNKDEIWIRVEDEGPGIPPDNLKRVFERFYTDRPGDHAFAENSGLGLNISEQIVLAHKGRIWAENRMSNSAGQGDHGASEQKILGACFTVILPASVTERKTKRR